MESQRNEEQEEIILEKRELERICEVENENESVCEEGEAAAF